MFSGGNKRSEKGPHCSVCTIVKWASPVVDDKLQCPFKINRERNPPNHRRVIENPRFSVHSHPMDGRMILRSFQGITACGNHWWNFSENLRRGQRWILQSELTKYKCLGFYEETKFAFEGSFFSGGTSNPKQRQQGPFEPWGIPSGGGGSTTPPSPPRVRTGGGSPPTPRIPFSRTPFCIMDFYPPKFSSVLSANNENTPNFGLKTHCLW